MEISLEEIQKTVDPYQVFLDSLRAKDTYRKYKSLLGSFLKLIPSKIYEEALGKSPMCQDVGTLAKHFVDLAKKNPDLATRIILAFVKNKIELVKKGEMSPNTLPNHVKPIKAFLDANGIPIHWKSIYKQYPRMGQAANDRSYTKEELQKMLEVATDITDKVIIQMFSAGGFRLESWDYFTWNDIVFFNNDDGTYKGAALFVYRGDRESYHTFLTPECCKTISLYRETWKHQTGKYPEKDDPLLKATKFKKIKPLKSFGVKRRVEKIVKKIGMRPPLPPGKRRHEVQLDHGFRKYFSTMMRRAKVDFLDKEDMMGHEVGLERHYERYKEEDFERFSEYQKAIPFLTISEEEKLRAINKQFENEKINLERRLPDLVKEAMERVKEDLLKEGWKPVKTL